MLVHSGLHYDNLRDSLVKVVGRYFRTIAMDQFAKQDEIWAT